MFPCDLPRHGDNGMMGLFVIVPGTEDSVPGTIEASHAGH